MEYIGKLVTGDFGDNTMTFEIEGEMTLQAGRYKIVQIEAGNAVKNNVDLADVVGRSEQLPQPDCHFYDEEHKKWIWAYSKELIDSLR